MTIRTGGWGGLMFLYINYVVNISEYVWESISGLVIKIRKTEWLWEHDKRSDKQDTESGSIDDFIRTAFQKFCSRWLGWW